MAENVDQSSVPGSNLKNKLVQLLRREETPEKVLKKIKKDPKFLPTMAQVKLAFNLGDEENLRGYWNVFARSLHGSHEILTKEYVSVLAGYLKNRTRLLGKKKENPGAILEVGAGEGNLAYHINNALNGNPGAYVLPTDAKKEWLEEKTVFPVEKLDVDAALLKYSPSIVIVSWMPEGVDWTSKFRNTPSVEEYILIGNTDHTGKTNDTWGDHRGEGFERVLLADLAQYQLPRFLGALSDDFKKVDARGAEKFESTTVSFRRNK